MENKINYKDIVYRSGVEEHFSWWLQELLDENLIEHFYYEHTNYELFKSEKLKYNIDDVSVKQNIGKCSYTPDFWIYCTKEQYKKLVCLGVNFIPSNLEDKELLEFIIEIKPKFNFQNKNEVAKIKIKWLYQYSNIYINMIHPTPILFESTYTPNEYLLTDTKKGKRKINWNVISLKDKLEVINSEDKLK